MSFIAKLLPTATTDRGAPPLRLFVLRHSTGESTVAGGSGSLLAGRIDPWLRSCKSNAL